MESESGVIRSIIHELRSLEILEDQMKGESGVTGCIIHELPTSDIQRDQMEGERGVTQSIIDQFHSSDIQEIKWKVKVLLLEVSLMNLILRIS